MLGRRKRTRGLLVQSVRLTPGLIRPECSVGPKVRDHIPQVMDWPGNVDISVPLYDLFHQRHRITYKVFAPNSVA